MDLYILLGVEKGATLDDIKRAYRRLARRFHPDINPGDRMAAQQFRQIAQAYETLSDPDRRRHYDTVGLAGSPAVPITFGFEGFDFSVSTSGMSASTFGDLFADVLQSRVEAGSAAQPERGPDVHHAVTLSLEAALRGGLHQVDVTRQDHCSVCRGIGHLPGAERRCTECRGSGVMKSARGHMVFSKPCMNCGGAGVLAEVRCAACGGQQVQMRREAISLQLPAGIEDGARIRVAAKGHAGRNGGEPGDLLIAVHVEPHDVFRREGDDLHVVVPLAVHEAALGAKVDVPSLDGPARLRVPPGTQTGQQFRLRERGAPSSRGTGRGDLIIEVRLVLPRVLDERSKELLREFGRINSDDVRQAGAETGEQR